MTVSTGYNGIDQFILAVHLLVEVEVNTLYRSIGRIYLDELNVSPDLGVDKLKFNKCAITLYDKCPYSII